ncbi:MAG TPA: class III extradiol ring-cleavage dioxygenase [Usitatibacteraceae bacterium]|nr:class III extradiol ring-cleavage dioxygenase [Usitatibacteraceae bacterium]
MPVLPTLFISHGSPLHAVQPGAAGAAWATLARTIPRPRALLVATAHWEGNLPMLSGNAHPETIHDFGGFPDALYAIRYAAPGAPELAARAAGLLKSAGITAGVDGCRGLDHGTWVPLRQMYPDADVPVVQLSVQPGRGPRHHHEVGRALAPLAAEGVLVIGSGHLTHNLSDWMRSRGQHQPLAYARNFQAWVFERLAQGAIEDLLAYRERAPEAERAHPTDEHFLPLFVALGAAGDAHAERVFSGFEGNALAMDAYRFG